MLAAVQNLQAEDAPVDREKYMDKEQMLNLLKEVEAGRVTPDDALLKMKLAPFEEVGDYAMLDHHRGLRQGAGEVIYGQSKTAEQIEGIVRNLIQNDATNILITRLDAEKAKALEGKFPFAYPQSKKVH